MEIDRDMASRPWRWIAFACLFMVPQSVAAQDLPSTAAEVPGVSVIALLSDMTSLEGFVWFEPDGVRYCLAGIDIACGGRAPLSSDPLVVGLDLQCGDDLTGTVDVTTAPSHAGAAIPKQAAGTLSDGRSLVALFGPFRVMDGVACAGFSPGPPDQDL